MPAGMRNAAWMDGDTGRGEKNLEAKTSPYIVEWESLPDHVQEWDREAVRNIPKLLAENGERIRR